MPELRKITKRFEYSVRICGSDVFSLTRELELVQNRGMFSLLSSADLVLELHVYYKVISVFAIGKFLQKSGKFP